jgi:bacterioferritin
MEYQTKSFLPYPEINIETPNYHECRLLMPAYAGKESETTAIMSYIYQHYILKPEYAIISEVLEEISITEMAHHDLLGTMIVQLGGTPIIGGNYNYWQGGYVNYAKNPLTILNNNIINEKKAIADYEMIVKKSKDSTVIEVIKRIILDEEIHVKTFELLKETLPCTQ